jgi:serine/threonine protein kinase
MNKYNKNRYSKFCINIISDVKMNQTSSSYDGKIAGLYDLEKTLGRGHFAVVKLARHVFTGEKVAVKVIDKSKLDDISKAQLFQEVNILNSNLLIKDFVFMSSYYFWLYI